MKLQQIASRNLEHRPSKAGPPSQPSYNPQDGLDPGHLGHTPRLMPQLAQILTDGTVMTSLANLGTVNTVVFGGAEVEAQSERLKHP